MSREEVQSDLQIPWKDERQRDLVEVVRCKDCHFFERNHFDSLDGVPIITAHNICTRWGNGCMTYENGYCFMGIRGERRGEVMDCREIINGLPSAETEIIHCCDCIYYDPEHIEKNGVRYEYRDMPKDAFDSLVTGLVNSEYGINVGGRCCRDYNVGYSEDKRVFVSGQNYCGRAERRQDE